MDMFIIYLLPHFNIAQVIAMKVKAKEKFHMVTILLTYQRNMSNEGYIFLQGLLLYIIPGPKHKW